MALLLFVFSCFVFSSGCGGLAETSSGTVRVEPGKTAVISVVSDGKTTFELNNRGPSLLQMTLIDPAGEIKDIGPTNFEPNTSLRKQGSGPQRVLLHNATQSACEVSYEAKAPSGGLSVSVETK